MLEKLIRHHLPDQIRARGEKCETRIAAPREMLKLLRDKLIEEVEELSEAIDAEKAGPDDHVNEELADVLEVVETLVALRRSNVVSIQLQKREDFGRFIKGVVPPARHARHRQGSLGDDQGPSIASLCRLWCDLATVRLRDGWSGSAVKRKGTSKMRYTFGGIALLLVLVFGIGWAVEGNDFFLFKFFAPKEEQVRYDTFKQSQAFNDGMAQQLDKAMIEYARAKDKDEKAAIGSVISHEFAGYDWSRLTQPERNFLAMLQGAQMVGGGQ